MWKTPLIAAFVASILAGCHLGRHEPSGENYRTVAADPRRDTESARAETVRGRALLEAGRLDQAEAAFKDALQADLFYGPAHNNLGTVYYRQKRHYLAAWEFQYAAKLMPARPEPKNNLGLVLEAVGRLDEAAGHYERALALASDSPELAGNLARCRIRQGRRDDETRELLQKVAMKDPRGEWADWARMQLIRLGRETPDRE